MKSLYQLYLARLREFRREPSAFFFVLFVPVLWMLVLGFALDNKAPQSKKIGVLTQGDQSSPGGVGSGSNKIHEILASLTGVTVVNGSAEQLQTRLRRGELNLVLGSEKLSDETLRIIYYFDDQNPEAQVDRLWVDRQIQGLMGQKESLATRDEAVTGYGTRYVDFLVPGLLAVSILSTSLFGVGMTIVSHRKDGLLKQLFVTPLRPSSYLVSHVLSRTTILFAEGGPLLLAAWLIFGFKVTGSWAAFLGLSLLGAGATTALATLLGSRLSHTGAMNGLSNLLMLPLMLLSGAWFSRHHFPQWLQTFSSYLPLTALVDGLRKVALEGLGWEAVGAEAQILVVYMVVGVFLSSRLFKWYEAG